MILLRKSPNQPSPGQNLRKSSLNSPLFASNLHKFWSRSRFPSRRTPKSDRLLVPRSTLFCGSESTKRAKTALQPLEIVHYSLRAAPCLDASGEL
uniref:Uncharacterized protein n=1 Tax=Candidatus Kentrum sp. DK TaxID=2126562 RepID=A0A450RZN4_9GAMM|nr:MAG: hypothetical protein BECKDK2373B_GA0170837_100810 [Candidatus Kentron sp. DK]